MSATSPSDLRHHLESPAELTSIFDKADDIKKDKTKNINFSVGASINGLNLELLKKNIIKKDDFLKLSFNMN
jgi:hypothetical protein